MPYRKRKKRKMPLYKQIRSCQAQIAKLKSLPEHKKIISSRTLGAPLLGATVFLLNGMQRGDAWGQREGNKVQMINTAINVYVSSSNAGAAQCRFMLVWHKQPQSLVLPTDTLFADITSNSTKVLCNKEPLTKDNYIYLYDKVFTFSGTANDNAQNRRLIKIRKLLNMPTIYNNADNGNIGDIEHGALYFVSVFDQIAFNFYYSHISGYKDV